MSIPVSSLVSRTRPGLTVRDLESLARFPEAVTDASGLHHVGRLTRGVWDFTVDALAVAPAWLAGDPAEADRLRRGLRTTGRFLVHDLEMLHRMLQPARTGALIRMVLQTPRGALFCYTAPGAHLVGLTLFDPTVEPGELAPGTGLAPLSAVTPTDRRLAELVDAERQAAQLGSLNPGGWAWLATHLDGWDPQTTRLSPDPPSSAAVVTTHSGAGAQAIVAECQAALSPEILHHVSHHTPDGDSFTLDVFDDPRVLPYFDGIRPALRRRAYASVSAGFDVLFRELATLVHPVIGRGLSRVVLDVEEGVLVVRQLPDGARLIALTLNQNAVSLAEEQIDALAERLASAG